MLFQSIGKPQYLNFALIAGVLLGIGSLSNVAIGQEKCEDSVPEVLEKFEPANHDAGGALDDEPDEFSASVLSQIEGRLENDSIESLDGDSTGQAQDSPPGSVEDLVQRPISQIRLSLNASLPTPQLKQPPSVSKNSLAEERVNKNYQWTAPNDYYRNLFFEEPLLERHGISRHPGLQPVISGFEFFKSGILLPLDIAKGRLKRCDNPLGWGVPGDHCR